MNVRGLVSFIAVFAALNVVCDSIVLPYFSSGVWYGLVFLIVPITGIILGPYAGFLSTFIGVLVGHFITPRGAEEFIFTLGAPLGALIAGFMFQRNWKPILLYYTILLAAYFLAPVSGHLSPIGMWDVYLAYFILFLLILVLQKGWCRQGDKAWYLFALSAFIGLEADILFRIFLFIPCRTYHSIYGFDIRVLQEIWMAGAVITPIKVAASSTVTAMLGTKLHKMLDLSSKTKGL